jgi:acetate kinase
MTDPRPLLSAIARLTKERDDYRDLCRDFSGAESPEALVAALRDRERMEAEIARLKTIIDGVDGPVSTTGLAVEAAQAREDWRMADKDSTRLTAELANHKKEIASLKADLAAAEEVARKAVEAIPIAMDAAAEKEREACAKIAEGFERNRDWVPGSLYDTLRREVAAAIRARGEGSDHA